jgi:hypothetical protein
LVAQTARPQARNPDSPVSAAPVTPAKFAVPVAARDGDVATLKKLLDTGADVNVSYYGWSPLHLAKTAEISELLISKGAKVNAMSDDARPGDAGFTPLYSAVAEDRLEVAEALIRRGAKVTGEQRAGLTPLHAARSAAAVTLLLENKADINAKDIRGATPLVLATTDEAAGALIDAGADVNLADRYGRTPPHRAAEAGWSQVVEWLAQKGADVQAKDELGRTPLHYASNKATFDALREYRAKDDVVDVLGHKPDPSGGGLPLEKRIEQGMTAEQLTAAMGGGPSFRIEAHPDSRVNIALWWYRGAQASIRFVDGKVSSWSDHVTGPPTIRFNKIFPETVVNDPTGK